MKRGRSGGSVTGGTGDIKPQILSLTTGLQPANDQYVSTSIALPVPRFSTGDKSTITEILWVDWYMGLENIADTLVATWAWLSTAVTRQNAVASTLATLLVDFSDPRVFAPVVQQRTLTTSGAGVVDYPRRIDLTDNNGNGFLVATDRLTVTMGSVGGTAGTTVCKIGYRLVAVGLKEYIGIVQGQQGTT